MASYDDMCNDAPSIIVLWDRTQFARKEYRCDRCGNVLPTGERYASLGIVTDGEFRHERTHVGAHRYPSGCPSIGLKDAADLAVQFACDKARYFPDA